MVIDLSMFDSGIGLLEFVVDNPRFRDDNWASAFPLLPDLFVAKLTAWDQKHPGSIDAFKLGFQYVMNTWDEKRLESWWDPRMDFGLPEPPMEFLRFVWEAIYPDEPWQRTFPDGIKVIPS